MNENNISLQKKNQDLIKMLTVSVTVKYWEGCCCRTIKEKQVIEKQIVLCHMSVSYTHLDVYKRQL